MLVVYGNSYEDTPTMGLFIRTLISGSSWPIGMVPVLRGSLAFLFPFFLGLLVEAYATVRWASSSGEKRGGSASVKKWVRLQGPPKIRSRRNARFCLCKPRTESQIAISEECIPIHGNCISRNSPFAFARSTLRLRLRFDSWQVLTDATSTPCMRPPVLYTACGTEQ